MLLNCLVGQLSNITSRCPCYYLSGKSSSNISRFGTCFFRGLRCLFGLGPILYFLTDRLVKHFSTCLMTDLSSTLRDTTNLLSTSANNTWTKYAKLITTRKYLNSRSIYLVRILILSVTFAQWEWSIHIVYWVVLFFFCIDLVGLFLLFCICPTYLVRFVSCDISVCICLPAPRECWRGAPPPVRWYGRPETRRNHPLPEINTFSKGSRRKKFFNLNSPPPLEFNGSRNFYVGENRVKKGLFP